MIEFPFLNLQYVFCLVYSWFGGKCAEVDPLDVNVASNSSDVPLEIASTATTLAGSSTSPDFFLWLFGGDALPEGSSTGTQESVAFFGSLFDSVFGGVWGVYSAIAYTFSGILALLIVGAAVGLVLIRQAESLKYGTLPLPHELHGNARSRWQQLLDHAISTNPKEWQRAILEADGMLGELLEKMGYTGEMTADRLRSVPEGAFVTLPNAWEAHRIRNFVSSNASDYILTQREAFRVMKLYEQVFEEFDFI